MRDRLKLLFLVGIVIGILAVPVLAALTGTAPVSGGVPLTSADGTTIVLEGETNIDGEELFPDSSTVELRTDDGNLTATSAGDVTATVAANNITGSWTRLSNIDVSTTDLTVDPEDKRPVTIGKGITAFEYTDSISIDDNAIDFYYASSGEGSVIVGGLPSDTDVAAVDAETGDLLDLGTTTSSGELTLSSLNAGEYDVELQERDSDSEPEVDSDSMEPTGQVRYENVTLSVSVDHPNFPSEELTIEWIIDGQVMNTTTATDPGTVSAEVGPLPDDTYDWYVRVTDADGDSVESQTKNFEVDHYLPQIDDIEPSGLLQSPPTEISAHVTDEDFAHDGDELDVTIELDGTVVHTETLTQNATVTTSMPEGGKTGGEHTITVTVDDSYGQTVTDVETYKVPDTLYIRNETNFDELVPADGEVRFFGPDEVYIRTAQGGTLNMTNLPVGETFIVEIEPTSDDYIQRTAYIESIYEQQNVYTLNGTKYDTIESRFVLDDPTGEYDSNSVLKIKRPINTSDGTKFQSIVADRFGAEGVTATLQNDTRYRLAITDGGTEQSIGPYRASISETVEVQPGQPTIDLSIPESGWEAGASLSDGVLEYRFVDNDDLTDKVVVYIHERGDPDNLLVGNETYISLGEASGKVSLTQNETETEWVVNFVVDRDGESFTKTVLLSDRQDLTPPMSDAWTSIIGVGLIILLAGAFSMLNAAIGAVVISIVGGLLWYIGFLGGATSGAAVAIALFISVIGYAYSTNR